MSMSQSTRGPAPWGVSVGPFAGSPGRRCKSPERAAGFDKSTIASKLNEPGNAPPMGGPWGGYGGPWGGMGGPWGGMGGPWGGMGGPWGGNPTGPSGGDNGGGDHHLDHAVHSTRRFMDRSMQYPDWVHPSMSSEARDRIFRQGQKNVASMMNPGNNGSDQPQENVGILPENEKIADHFGVYNGFFPSGITATDTKLKLLEGLKDCLKDNKILEEKRQALSLRSDFIITDIFSLIDIGQTGYVSLNDLRRFTKISTVNLNREDWLTVIDRYDFNNDGYLSYSEFTELWAPYTQTYRKRMVDRKSAKITDFKQYTAQTRKLIKDLVYSIVTAEENFECSKYKICGGLVALSHECFDFLDKNKDGFITLNEFTACLKDHQVTKKAQEAKYLFMQYDKNHDSKVDFGEFHTPSKAVGLGDYYYVPTEPGQQRPAEVQGQMMQPQHQGNMMQPQAMK